MNKLGNPLVFSLFSIARRQFKSRFYGYMDIKTLLNPAIFKALESIKKDMDGYLSDHPIVIITNSFILPISDLKDHLNSFQSCNNLFSSISKQNSRTVYSVPIFTRIDL